MRFTPDELRPLAIFDGLGDEPLSWLSDHGTRIVLNTGERMFNHGQPADFMFIVVSGKIERYEEIGGQWLMVATTVRGQVTGMLPYSRMTHYPGHTIAAEPSEVLRVKKTDFDAMLAVSQALGKRLVAEMSNRVRGDVRLEQQREKMMALGRLSAGLAHELNNPTAAIRRTVATLGSQIRGQTEVMIQMAKGGLENEAIDGIRRLRDTARRRDAPDLSPLERSDREEDLAAWLEEHGIDEAWEIASALAETGLREDDLERCAEAVPEASLADALAWVAGNIQVDRMLEEISSSAGRVSELVASVKVYTHMDRSSEHTPTDVREGLDKTLTMFGHKIKQKNIRLVRGYPDTLPTIPGNAGELNQVWTNLIDNAIDAMTDGGALRIEVGVDDWCVDVKVIDDGRGIPDEIRPRIFDPFFTTKDVGEGTGLGLDIARRIVQTHRGQIDVRSRPGGTEVLVRLPIAPEERVG